MIAIQKVKNKQVYFVSPVSGVKTNKSIMTLLKKEGKLYKKGVLKINLKEVYMYELGALECRRKLDTEKGKTTLQAITELFEAQIESGLKNTKSESWSKSFRLFNYIKALSEKLNKKYKLNELGYSYRMGC